MGTLAVTNALTALVTCMNENGGPSLDSAKTCVTNLVATGVISAAVMPAVEAAIAGALGVSAGAAGAGILVAGTVLTTVGALAQLGQAISDYNSASNTEAAANAALQSQQQLQPIADAWNNCDFQTALGLAQGLNPPPPGLQTILPNIQKGAAAQPQVESLLGQANATTDPTQKQQLLSQALAAAGDVSCLKNQVTQASQQTQVAQQPDMDSCEHYCMYDYVQSSAPGDYMFCTKIDHSVMIDKNNTADVQKCDALITQAQNPAPAPAHADVAMNSGPVSAAKIMSPTPPPVAYPGPSVTLLPALPIVPNPCHPTIVLKPSSFGPSHPANLPVVPNPCHPTSASAVPPSGGIVLKPSSSGPSHPANLPAVPNPCHPTIASTVPPSSIIKRRPSSPGTILMPKTAAITPQPSVGQTHVASTGSQPNPCHGLSSSTSAGNTHRSASLTPSGHHVTSSRFTHVSHASRGGRYVSHASRGGRGGRYVAHASRGGRYVVHASRGGRYVVHASRGGRGGRYVSHASRFRTTFRPTRVARRSDVRLKEDIVPVARLDNGIGVYRFRYKGNDHTVYVGVMAQEVQTIMPSAVSRDRDGYLRVDYDQLGLEFMTWDEWVARSSTRSRTVQ